MKEKKATIVHEMILHIVLVGLLFALFFVATAGRVDNNSVKQQIVEKQTSLLIESAVPGMSFAINKINRNGRINKIEIKEGRVFAYLGNQQFSKGYPYFTRYKIELEEDEEKYLIKISEKN